MPQDAALEDEMAHLWDDANLLILAVPFDVQAATEVERKLRDCAGRAGVAHRPFSANQLTRMADQVAAMIQDGEA